MSAAQRPVWRANVLTLFPAMFPGPLGQALAGRALSAGLWNLATHDMREHGLGPHRSVDDAPFGGGAGMVLRPDVVDLAIGAALEAARLIAPRLVAPGLDAPGAGAGAGGEVVDACPLVCLTPRGRTLAQVDVRGWAEGPGVVLLCGRYEGIDQRVIEARGAVEISVGDYVLAGGEVAAMVLLEACVRLLPGVMGGVESAVEESFADGLLEYPHYTRPAEWAGRRVPDVLLSGNHAAIAAWREGEAERITRERRPDLWARRRGNIATAAVGP